MSPAASSDPAATRQASPASPRQASSASPRQASPASPRQAGGRVLRARGQATRARLLAAGADVLAHKGFHAARVDDIVTAARSSHGTFYLYFASKDDLFDHLVGQVAAELEVLVASLPELADTDEGRARLRQWLTEFTDLYERSGPVIRVWTEAEVTGEGIGGYGEDVLGAMTLAMSRAIAATGRVDVDPTVAALALMMMVERLNYYVTSRQVRASRDELLDTLVEAMTSALFA